MLEARLQQGSLLKKIIEAENELNSRDEADVNIQKRIIENSINQLNNDKQAIFNEYIEIHTLQSLEAIYEKYLSEDEHLNNFIIDAPNTEEMLARYERNNILDTSGNISYSKLVEKNPDCNAFLYRIDRMTTSKKDPVSGCDY